ncbi:hypothetical protein Tco_1081034 [Tanacetum coccineum]|uniref:Gag-pol polyprotein n=1 Tax=Tanacetum coccineum TaxID=301880 RepID=A0ABQ5HXP5_9ASTR
MIGSLMYLTSSRPDLVQAVCYCVRYHARPTEKHLKEVKRIFRYLKETINMRLCTSGRIQFLGEKLVSWMSKKHDCTAMSTAEAEYATLSASCAQVMWMRTQLKDYGFATTEYSSYRHVSSCGCLDTRKSTSGGIQFLGENLVSWMSKKHDCTAMSTAEAEYATLSASCAQVMWMRKQLKDYGFATTEYCGTATLSQP